MREYVLHLECPPPKKFVFEEIGNGLKRVSGGAVSGRPGNSSNLSRGRQRAGRCRGWTVATRRTSREILEENLGEFQCMAHLRFRSGNTHDPELLNKVRIKLSRWLRAHVDGYYFWAIEFMPRSTDPHFHVGITQEPEELFLEEFKSYWLKISGGGELTSGEKPGEDQMAIGRYLAKSRTKENPDWFNASPFKPYATNLPKKQRRRIEVDLCIAEAAGLTKHRFTHDGSTKLKEAMAGAGFGCVSPFRDIHEKPDNGDTCEDGKRSDNGDIQITAYVPSTEAERMKRACATCWFKRLKYVPRQGEICPKCGFLWTPATPVQSPEVCTS